MSLAEVVQSSGWKNFMAKLYGIGASIVIIGALFKIQHYQFAGLMLGIGLCTEAIIFFFSAFEPLHEDVDWTLVYPELAGIPDEEPGSVGMGSGRGGGMVGAGGGAGGVGGGSGSVALMKFDEMLEKAKYHSRAVPEPWNRNEKIQRVGNQPERNGRYFSGIFKIYEYNPCSQ